MKERVASGGMNRLDCNRKSVCGDAGCVNGSICEASLDAKI